MVKQLPNLLSASRAALACPIAVLALNQEWVLAFWLFAAAVTTDLLDGWLAKRLHAQTDLGKKWIDPIADGAMTAGAMWGTVFQDGGLENFWRWGLLMLLVGILLKWLKHQERFHNLRRFAILVLPLCYTTMIVILLNLYAVRAFDWGQTGWILTSIIFTFAVWWKYPRIAEWKAGQL